MHLKRHAALAILLLVSLLPAQGKNLLFYGNSFSYFNSGVARIVQAIAVKAGFPAPVYQERLIAGQDLRYHATDPAQIAAISNFLPAGQTWDVVIMQGLSTEATLALGHPAQFVNDAITLFGNVRNHSPACKGVMYQTWARGQGHSYYPGTFASPLAMHNEVRSNYRLAVSALEGVYGAGAVENSAVGDGMALLEFAPSMYFTDLQHPANSLTVLASMCLFTSIYRHTVSDITPNFSQPDPLATLLTSMLITPAEWTRLAGIADCCAARSLRPYPGSGDELLLNTATQPGPLTAGPWSTASTASLMQVQVAARNGVFTTAPAFLVGSLFVTGQPPVPTASMPEVAVDLGSLVILRSQTSLQNPLLHSMQLPFSLAGMSILVQGVALAASTETGNPTFTTTEGHEFVLQ